MIFKKSITFVIKFVLLNFLSIIYTIPKLLFIAFKKNNYINLTFSSKKLKKRKDVYIVNLNFESDLIWNPIIPLPFINEKVKSIYSINLFLKMDLEGLFLGNLISILIFLNASMIQFIL